jgi:rare lipoprotein A
MMNKLTLLKIIVVFFFLAFAVLFCFLISNCCEGQNFTASWYSRASTISEGCSGICANREVFKDDGFTAASWDYPFGTMLRVTNLNNDRAVVVRVTDRGPAKKLYRKGRVIDLSKAAFKKIAKLSDGVIPVRITKKMSGRYESAGL